MKILNVKSISAKLMFVSIALGVAFLFLVILAVFSFRNLENQLETTLANNLGRIKENTRIGRELSQGIDQLNLVKNTFFTNDKELKSGKIKILQQLETTLKNSSDPQLNIQLEQFVTEARRMLDQCEAVNLSYSHVENISKTLSEKLAALDEKSKRKKSELILKNEHSVAWEETAILMPGLSSTQLLMHERLNGLGLNFFQQPLDDIWDHPILILAEDLIWRIRSMQRINPDISRSTKELLTALDTYTQHIGLFHYNAVEFKKKLAAMDLATTSMLSQIDKIDQRITEGIAAIYNDMADKMSAARRSLIFFSIILIIALGLCTVVFINSNIRKPMDQICEGIQLLSTGTLSTRIHLNRHDDWQLIEEALNQMATELQRVYDDLKAYRNQLEVKVKTRTEELGNANASLKAAKEEAENANRAKSAFLASMSHELRTPLNSIIGFTGIILNELTGPLNLEQKKQLKMVKGSSRHLLALINDVLDISKIEAGELEVFCETFSIRNIVDQVADTLMPLADQKGLSLSVMIAPEVDILVSDERRIQQVLINLANNAIKFTEKGGVKITCFKRDSHIEVHVTDSGIGINKGDIEKLFKPFQQLDTGTSRIYEGTGLGLSVCKRILDMLGGNIRVKSQFGKGSTFSFTLPMKPEEKYDKKENPDH